MSDGPMVFVLQEFDGTDGMTDDVLGVFSTRERAESAMAEELRRRPTIGSPRRQRQRSLDILEFVIDRGHKGEG